MFYIPLLTMTVALWSCTVPHCVGTWSTPTTTGDCPPPCVDFSFTRVDEHRAVVFGGYQPEAGTVADTYILNMETWVNIRLYLCVCTYIVWSYKCIVALCKNYDSYETTNLSAGEHCPFVFHLKRPVALLPLALAHLTALQCSYM